MLVSRRVFLSSRAISKWNCYSKAHSFSTTTNVSGNNVNNNYEKEKAPSAKVAALAEGILQGDRVSLARGITLVESLRIDHQQEATWLVSHVLRHSLPPTTSPFFSSSSTSPHHHPHTFRIGISGAPGVGKSTFIESFGSFLTANNHKVAVLAVDPSSSLSGGSILGDKTRMPNLSRDINAYVRPSPTRGTLGGITRTTADAITLVEASHFDVVIVETVGVGQSEFAVADLVDIMVLLVSPGGGDELQGIKKGIMELADLLVVTKADGPLLSSAHASLAEYSAALSLTSRASRSSSPSSSSSSPSSNANSSGWKPRAMLHSVREANQTQLVWDAMMDFRKTKGHELHLARADQNVLWMWRIVEDLLLKDMKGRREIQEEVERLEREVRDKTSAPSSAAISLLQTYLKIKSHT